MPSMMFPAPIWKKSRKLSGLIMTAPFTAYETSAATRTSTMTPWTCTARRMPSTLITKKKVMIPIAKKSTGMPG